MAKKDKDPGKNKPKKARSKLKAAEKSAMRQRSLAIRRR